MFQGSFVYSSQVRAYVKKVSVIGSGNWGTAISRIIGSNVKKHDDFDNRVKMYVHEELVDGKKLSEIINETHFNVKYLPRHRLPDNVIAVPDLIKCSHDADILVFVTPHQFVKNICSTLAGNIKESAVGLTLIKGLETADGGGIQPISHVINRSLNIQVSAMMGANIAVEIADENFCETTLGCKDRHFGNTLKKMIQTDYFRVVVVDDVSTVELCGALKNIVACAAGFVDGLELGDNTKAAVIRLGLFEMMKFIDRFFKGTKISTYLESCGVADLITTCYGGSRNKRVAVEFVRTGRPLKDLEEELLNGQKLQGVLTAEEVNFMLKNVDKEEDFPLFTAVHKICTLQMKPQQLIEAIKVHPAHV